MEVFVFGSNLAGRHGKSSALEAVQHHGAIYGKGWGIQGSSYAIPTKDWSIKILPLPIINTYVRSFLHYAENHPDDHFTVVRIGCGLAGYVDADIIPMFQKAPSNCTLPHGWRLNGEEEG